MINYLLLIIFTKFIYIDSLTSDFFISNRSLEIPEQDFACGVSSSGYLYLIGGSSGVDVNTQPPPRRILIKNNINFNKGINNLDFNNREFQSIIDAWPPKYIMNSITPKNEKEIRIATQSYTQQNNKLYMLTTDNSGSNYASNLLIYDFNTDYYVDYKLYQYKLLKKTSSYMCVTSTKENLYVFGGYFQPDSHIKTQIFNFKTKKWTFGADIYAGDNIIGIDSTACNTNSKETIIYLFGGWITDIHGNFDITDKILKYNISANNWVILNEKLTTPQAELRSILNKESDFIYLFGAYIEPFNNIGGSKDVDIFDNYLELFLPINTFPKLKNSPLSAMCVTQYDNIIFVLGGYNAPIDEGQNTIQYAFMDVFSSTEPLHACCSINNKIHYLFNIDVKNERVYIEALLPTDTWYEIGLNNGNIEDGIYLIKINQKNKRELNSGKIIEKSINLITNNETELSTSIPKIIFDDIKNNQRLIRFWRPLNGITNKHYTFPKKDKIVSYMYRNGININININNGNSNRLKFGYSKNVKCPDMLSFGYKKKPDTIHPTLNTKQPTIIPTIYTNQPTPITNNPTVISINPTKYTNEPTNNPTIKPSMNPTKYTPLPTVLPTQYTNIPTINPSLSTLEPTRKPTDITNQPTIKPTMITINPTIKPTMITNEPSVKPTMITVNPTLIPTKITNKPTVRPTDVTYEPTNRPTKDTGIPTYKPTDITFNPTNNPTKLTNNPTNKPTKLTNNPTINPTDYTLQPTINPTDISNEPTVYPTILTLNPTNKPTLITNQPTINPTDISLMPTLIPTKLTIKPTIKPTKLTNNPTNNPIINTNNPTINPSINPTKNPVIYGFDEYDKIIKIDTISPTNIPTTKVPTTKQPTTMHPTMNPTLKPTTMTPTTQHPTTLNPTTLQPTTKQPTTKQPTTKNPTTLNPTTLKPTTLKPTTMNPTTLNPTTKQPTTIEPTTKQPTTQKPTTKEPTTKNPTHIKIYKPVYGYIKLKSPKPESEIGIFEFEIYGNKVSKNEIYMKITVPMNIWFSIGFNATKMSDKPYTIFINGNGRVTERKLSKYHPGKYLVRTITILSRIIKDGNQILELKRSLIGRTNDYYSFIDKSNWINVIYAHQKRDDMYRCSLCFHGKNNYGNSVLLMSYNNYKPTTKPPTSETQHNSYHYWMNHLLKFNKKQSDSASTSSSSSSSSSVIWKKSSNTNQKYKNRQRLINNLSNNQNLAIQSYNNELKNLQIQLLYETNQNKKYNIINQINNLKRTRTQYIRNYND